MEGNLEVEVGEEYHLRVASPEQIRIALLLQDGLHSSFIKEKMIKYDDDEITSEDSVYQE